MLSRGNAGTRLTRRKLLRVFYTGFDLAVIGVLLLLAMLFYVRVYGEAVVSRQAGKLVLDQSSVITDSEGNVLRRIPLPESGYRTMAQLEEILSAADRHLFGSRGPQVLQPSGAGLYGNPARRHKQYRELQSNRGRQQHHPAVSPQSLSKQR